MPSAQMNQSVVIGGVDVRGSITKTGEVPISYEPVAGETSRPAGKAGTLSTRTSDTAGTLTLGSGHGITDGQEIMIFWSTAFAYYATVGTVAGTSVPFTGAAGTVLPSQGTAIVASVQSEVAFNFAGSNAAMLAIAGDRRCGVLLAASDDTVHLAKDVAAGGGYFWDGNGTNPVSGDTINKLVIGNGDSANALLVRAGVLTDQ